MPKLREMRTPRNLLPFAFCLLLFLGGCQEVQKPAVKGRGDLAVSMPRGTAAAEYHSPPEVWRANHKTALARGDFSERECVLCHQPQTSCNRCHRYVGAREIEIPEADFYWPDLKDRS